MLNAVAMLGGGMWVQRKIGELSLPSISRPADDVASFKLSVRVHAASVPGLQDSRYLRRERPKVEVILGQARKETELGDYKAPGPLSEGTSGSSSESPSSSSPASSSSAPSPKQTPEEEQEEQSSVQGAGAGADESLASPRVAAGRSSDAAAAAAAATAGAPKPSECPWHFGDTLTFTVGKTDLFGPAMQVWVRTQDEVRFGQLFQMNMSSTSDVGVCSLDLRRRVLPACSQHTSGDDAALGFSEGQWESPVMVLPLTYIGGRAENGERAWVLGEAAGHVAVSFCLNVDPQQLLTRADAAAQPLHVRAVQPFREWTARTADSVAASLPSRDEALSSAREWSSRTAQAASSGVQWVFENSGSVESCTHKTRDRASRFYDDVQPAAASIFCNPRYVLGASSPSSSSSCSPCRRRGNSFGNVIVVSSPKKVGRTISADGHSPSFFLEGSSPTSVSTDANTLATSSFLDQIEGQTTISRTDSAPATAAARPLVIQVRTGGGGCHQSTSTQNHFMQALPSRASFPAQNTYSRASEDGYPQLQQSRQSQQPLPGQQQWKASGSVSISSISNNSNVSRQFSAQPQSSQQPAKVVRRAAASVVIPSRSSFQVAPPQYVKPQTPRC